MIRPSVLSWWYHSLASSRALRVRREKSSSLLLSSLELSDTKVYAPQMRARLGTAAHFCEVVILKLRTAPIGSPRRGSSAGGVHAAHSALSE